MNMVLYKSDCYYILYILFLLPLAQSCVIIIFRQLAQIKHCTKQAMTATASNRSHRSWGRRPHFPFGRLFTTNNNNNNIIIIIILILQGHKGEPHPGAVWRRRPSVGISTQYEHDAAWPSEEICPRLSRLLRSLTELGQPRAAWTGLLCSHTHTHSLNFNGCFCAAARSGWFGIVLMVFGTSTKLSYAEPG